MFEFKEGELNHPREIGLEFQGAGAEIGQRGWLCKALYAVAAIATIYSFRHDKTEFFKAIVVLRSTLFFTSVLSSMSTYLVSEGPI